MANLALENLGSRGFEVDPKPYELSPEVWSYASNVSFSKLGAHKFKGHQLVYDTTMLHTPYWLFPWKSSTGFSWLYAGLARIARIVNTAHTDVTRFTTVLGDDDYSGTVITQWSGTLLGDLPLLTNDTHIDVPQQWSGSRFENLANWPVNTFADIMVTLNNFAVALRVKKPATAFNPRLVKWSEPADPGTYPNSWDETDPTKLTGEVTLADTEGEIVAGIRFGKVLLIYKSDSVVSMTFTGGQAIFSFRTEFSEFGALSRESVGVLENTHFVVTEGDVVVHNGQTFKSVIDKRNRTFLFTTIKNELRWKTQVKVYEQATEVWICYADVNSLGQLNQALIWNYADNTWSHRELQEFNYLALGFIDTSTVSQTFDSGTGSFNTDLGVFDAQAATPVFDEILAVDSGNTQLLALNATEQFAGVPVHSILERTGIALVGRDRQGEWKTDLDSRKFVRRIHPKLSANGPVNFYVGSQEVVDGPVTWEGPCVFDPNTESYFDVRVNTKFIAFRLESQSDITWTLYGYTIDLDIIGQAPE